VPQGGLQISDDGKSATLATQDVPVIDQPKWPAHHAPATPATLSFRVVWKATDGPHTYEDKSKHFRVQGYRATAQLEATVEVPTLHFSWKSDPLAMSSAAFAIIGTEVNEKYYIS
jgi:hypothetical protein